MCKNKAKVSSKFYFLGECGCGNGCFFFSPAAESMDCVCWSWAKWLKNLHDRNDDDNNNITINLCTSISRAHFIQMGREIEQSFASWMFLLTRRRHRLSNFTTLSLDWAWESCRGTDEMERSWYYLNEVAANKDDDINFPHLLLWMVWEEAESKYRKNINNAGHPVIVEDDAKESLC